MNDPFSNASLDPGWAPLPSQPPEEGEHPGLRRRMRQRFLALLMAGATAFALTTWTLVRYEHVPGLAPGHSDAATLVKAHLDALSRGDLRGAYAQFSQRYRSQVSFEAFHELVTSHRAMFRTRELAVSSREESGDRTVLETHTVTQDGERYQARYTLVRAEGRWWIDDLRWGAEPEENRVITV